MTASNKIDLMVKDDGTVQPLLPDSQPRPKRASKKSLRQLFFLGILLLIFVVAAVAIWIMLHRVNMAEYQVYYSDSNSNFRMCGTVYFDEPEAVEVFSNEDVTSITAGFAGVTASKIRTANIGGTNTVCLVRYDEEYNLAGPPILPRHEVLSKYMKEMTAKDSVDVVVGDDVWVPDVYAAVNLQELPKAIRELCQDVSTFKMRPAYSYDDYIEFGSDEDDEEYDDENDKVISPESREYDDDNDDEEDEEVVSPKLEKYDNYDNGYGSDKNDNGTLYNYPNSDYEQEATTVSYFNNDNLDEDSDENDVYDSNQGGGDDVYSYDDLPALTGIPKYPNSRHADNYKAFLEELNGEEIDDENDLGDLESSDDLTGKDGSYLMEDSYGDGYESNTPFPPIQPYLKEDVSARKKRQVSSSQRDSEYPNDFDREEDVEKAVDGSLSAFSTSGKHEDSDRQCCKNCRRGRVQCSRVCVPVEQDTSPYFYKSCAYKQCSVVLPCQAWRARSPGSV